MIAVAAPCSLPLGLVRLEHGSQRRLCMLGITLQHPPVSLVARRSQALTVTGARADMAYAWARQFLQQHGLADGAEVEIELAVPAFVGLGSAAVLGLSVARALGALQPMPPGDTPALAAALSLGPQQALEIWGFDRGGILLVDTQAADPSSMPPPLRRHEIAHAEQEAWAFVFHFPPAPLETPETLEADRMAALLKAAPALSPGTGPLFEEVLWPALEAGDLSAFGRALMAIQRLSREALERAGAPAPDNGNAQRVLDIMRENGAVAWGQSLTGWARYGLIRGAAASIELRKLLGAYVGYEGGTVMATICDNRGARVEITDDA